MDTGGDTRMVTSKRFHVPDQNLCGACLDVLDELPAFIEHYTDHLEVRRASVDSYFALAWSVGNVKIADLDHSPQRRSGDSCGLCLILSALKPRQRRQQHDNSEVSQRQSSLWACRFLGRAEGPHVVQSADLPSTLGLDADFFVLSVPLDERRPNEVLHPTFRKQSDYEEVPAIALYNKKSVGALLCTPKIVPPQFDPTTAIRWVRACKAQHECCGSLSDERTEIILIDCETWHINSLDTSYHYVALSYVWGNIVPKPLMNGTQVPADTSAVILDAIEVTKSLGYRYLWADQYCINQSDPVVKMRQINQMDIVYGQAELTIVAACGDSAGYGLPGVSRRPRKVFQKPIEVGDFRIVALGPDGQSDMATSKWCTRGWTFQEAWLSRRILCFTDYQTYFECGGISCAESLEYSDQIWQMDNPGLNFRHLSYGPYSRLDQQEHLSSPMQLISRINLMIRAYSIRELSFDGDGLRAVSGVLNHSETIHLQSGYALGEPTKFRTLCGIPVIIGDFFGKSLLEQTLVSGLSWYHEAAQWSHGNVFPSRRTTLPSWSWAGWKGPVNHCWALSHAVAYDFVIKDVSITVKRQAESDPAGIPIAELTVPIEASTLCFDAIQIPQNWLSTTLRYESYHDWFLCGSSVVVYASEPIASADLLRSLEHGEHKLVLISYSSDEKMGLIWILRKTKSSYARAGIIFIGRGTFITGELATESLNEAMLSLIQTATPQRCEIE